MRSTLALLALGAASVAAVAVPKDVTQMKRDIIARQGKSLVKRNSVTQGGMLLFPLPSLSVLQLLTYRHCL